LAEEVRAVKHEIIKESARKLKEIGMPKHLIAIEIVNRLKGETAKTVYFILPAIYKRYYPSPPAEYGNNNSSNSNIAKRYQSRQQQLQYL
jgi:hypothetical protein